MTYRLTTSEDYQKLIDDYDTWLFDCDGVLWCGDRLIDGVAEYWTFFDNKVRFQGFAFQTCSFKTHNNHIDIFKTKRSCLSRITQPSLDRTIDTNSSSWVSKQRWYVTHSCNLYVTASNFLRACRTRYMDQLIHQLCICLLCWNFQRTWKHMYVIGMAGLEEELREEGITFLGGTVCSTLVSCIEHQVNLVVFVFRTHKTTLSSHSTWPSSLKI